ncbi:conserved unknown protein [Ectocarpus siliculosus]|uniref:TPM domain-containing protein n=1 Tax=Ectocarpus siliculosus TaxID=2880 RepID=D7FR26_ECTSI|nr:conserved unknown protein [Ectocarpus siliculosus]|eukprot:CBJ26093.1 conserved unknown protein [Ectocarpus siliculosus]
MLASPPGGGEEGGGGVGINVLRKGGGVVGGDEEVTAEGFARGVQDSWRVGKRGCDNGFVLVASREDRSFAISVGKGLERYLPPRDRNAALNAMKPLLREGDWDGAVVLALEEIHGRLVGNLAKAAGGGGDGGAGALSSLGWGWEDLKRWASDGWGGSGGGSGSGDGGGGGGGFRGFHLGGFENFFRESWNVDVPPGSVLLALSLLWGGATARASLQRRRYDRFEAKLAGIEAQRAMLPLSAAGGGWLVGQDALASRGVCPICLDAFSEAADGSGADTKGLVGADGMPAATLPDCGHTFCQRPSGASANPGVSRTGRLGETGGEQARERARREAAFQLASLGSQYPKFLDDRTVNRWLSKDYSSSWSRDPMLALNRPQDTGSDNGRVGGGGARKGSGWVTNGSRGLGGEERRSYGGGSSSSATGGGW